MKKTFSILIFISFSRLLIGQTQIEKPDRDSLVKFSFECNGKKRTYKVPCGHLNPKYSEDHHGWRLITLNYPDSSFINILCGKYSLLLSDNYRGEDYFERKEYVDHLTIVYEFVKKDRLKYFEKSFNKIAKNK